MCPWLKTKGFSKLEGTKDNLGVQVHLGSEKCHSPSLIGPIPRKNATSTMVKAQRGVGFCAKILTKLAQTSHQRMTRWQSSGVHNLIKRPRLKLKLLGNEWQRLKDWRAREKGLEASAWHYK
ncbi:hypothetical protein Tco_1061153 [Tanacetum coccineum]